MSCCHEPEAIPESQPEDSKPAAAKPPASSSSKCQCCGELPDSTPPEPASVVIAPELAGDFILVEFLAVTAIPREHLRLLGGLDPPEGAGVDALYESLFSRHVLRC
jgi:hypothetical protein